MVTVVVIVKRIADVGGERKVDQTVFSVDE